MKKTLLLGLTTGAMIMFSGCGARGPQFTNFEKPKNPNNGMLYIYRKAQLFGDGLTYNVTINDDYVVKMRLNGYTKKELPKGVVKLYSSTSPLDKTSFKLVLPKNKIICVKSYIGFGLLLGRPKFELVDMKQCKKEIKDTKKELE